MKPHEIETWTLTAIEQLQSRAWTEDARIDVKSQWPADADETARRIAGHANAARGEPILWIIGVDERMKEVKGAAYEELATWWEAVKSRFDGIAPSVTDLNVPVLERSVVALLFETDRSPFVVKNPLYGHEKGNISYEVPWREGTSTTTTFHITTTF